MAETDREIATRRQEFQWQMHLDLYRHNDGITVTLGTEALKTAVLINAGASVALLAFAAQLWGSDLGRGTARQVLNGMTPFVVGVIAAGLAFLAAYVYSYLLTWRRWRDWQNFGETDKSKHKSPKPLFYWAVFMAGVVVLSVIASYAAFALGIWREMAFISAQAS